MNYILHILIMICIYLILSLSLNLLVGYTGLLSLCHAAFYGIGAYASTLLITKFGLNFFLALPAGVGITMILSLLVAYPSLRLKGDYFILTAFGFQIIVFSVLYNWVGLTRGPYGIPGIPKPSLLGFEFDSLPLFLLLSAVFALLVFFVLYRISASPFGRVLKAIREDELVASALGKNVANFKIWAFMIAGGIAAIAGSLYAGYVTYIDPTSFTLDESIFILAIILVGGSGNIRGPIVGTIFMIILPEALRFLGIPDTIAPNVRQMIYGALLVFLMFFRAQGIAGEYKFE
ncbi:TPA: branched-chain amino acid ABC transporter permease [Candidatus Poribacteria bacterium]|nr:branched-chain amino acid ABC transporter permease [Candidatus Poribacteria bacterium]